MTTTSQTWAPPTEFAEQLHELYGLTCPPRWGTPRRPHFPSLGAKAAKVMEALGYPPMPWQRYVLDVALEIDPTTGLFAYREVGLSVPRQQGKTQQILGLMVHRIMAWQRQNVVYAAQTRNDALKRLEDEFAVTLEDSRLAGKYRKRMKGGNEAILWLATRSRMGITSNTEKAGHGPPLDLGVIDEAFAHEDDRLEQAFSPAMLTRQMAQLLWASAGGTEKSVWLNKKRAAGREHVEALWRTGVHPAVAYFEWFAPDDMPRDDPATWRACMPALGHTVTEATVRAELDKLDAVEFDRAYLNRTKRFTPPPDLNVPTKEWPQRADEQSDAGSLVAFAVDITPARDHAAIGLVGRRPDGRWHVELVDHAPGTDWLVGRLVELKQRWNPVAIGVDAMGAAGSLLLELEKVGITRPKDPDDPKRGDLAIPNSREVAQACGQFADAVRHDQMRHIDQAQLNDALAGARTRTLGDAWAWARKGAACDISPLVAVTVAGWAYATRVEKVTADYNPLGNIG